MQFYLSWAQHEPEPGQFDFSGLANITEWVNIAQSLGLNVIARIGPYMDAEQDMGGLPPWLLKDR